MRALLLIDDFFASRERAMLGRLEVGLADEGVRVIQALPERLVPMAGHELAARTLAYEPRLIPLTRRFEAVRLAEAALRESEGEKVDVVHVFGGSAWRLGMQVAEELNAALALEVWRSGLVGRAKGLSFAGRRVVLMAPDVPIARALSEGVEPCPVRLAPWGVVAESSVRAILQQGRVPGAMIVGSGRDVVAFQAALTGIARVIRMGRELLIFCDALAARRARLWALARRLEILQHISLIEEIEARRDLLLQGDLIIQPDANGEARSVLLDAMGAGVLVIAAEDPFVGVLMDGRTARLVPEGNSQAWASTLEDVLGDVARARALSAQAHEFVRANRRASDHVRAVLQAYEAAGVKRPG
jgi:hypothetical protein